MTTEVIKYMQFSLYARQQSASGNYSYKHEASLYQKHPTRVICSISPPDLHSIPQIAQSIN